MEAAEAVEESLRGIRKGLGAKRPDALFVFVSPHHSDSYDFILERLQSELKPKHLVGCSAGGVIGEGRELEDNPGLSLTAALLPEVQVKTLKLSDADLPDADSPPRAWEELVGVPASEQPQFLLLLSPFMGKAEELLAGLDYAFPRSPKVGGIVSGLRGVGERTMFLDGERVSDGAVMMCLSGKIALDTLVAQGCRGLGGVHTITGCERNMLKELDGKPALKLLTEIYEAAPAGDRKLMNRALFLGIINDPLASWPPKHGDFLIRNVLGIDAGSRSLAIAALLREGQAVSFHVRDAEAASEDLRQMLERYQNPGAAGALLFSCLGRGEGMYGKADHDSGLFRSRFGGLALGGFFCNGEIGPVGSQTFIHGFTSSFGIFRQP
jgi:small ligand-binding sensory domain FIST